jgi:hypothetical protein
LQVFVIAALRSAKLFGPLECSAKGVAHISAWDARFSELIDIQAEELSQLRFERAILSKGVRIKTPVLHNLNLNQAELSGSSIVKATSIIEISGNHAKFQCDLKILAKNITTLSVDGAFFQGNMTIEGRIRTLSLSRATICKELRMERSEIDNSNAFSSTKFAASSELYLSGTRFAGNQEIIGQPKSIDLNDIRVPGKLTIHSEFGARQTEVVADKNRSELGRVISFANVDLSRLMLLGHSIDKIWISNVRWAKRYWRNVLYDEIVMRKEGKTAPWGNLKEAYQILKEKYSKLGDHASSGDFHYGEMEAKRRQYGWPKRVLCPEFLYWAFSGYGIGYVRAFLILVLFLAGSAAGYYFFGGIALESDLHKSFLFSLQTAILLRPTRPSDFSAIGEWIQVAQSVLVPMQAALFILALRMRLKR